jgi:fructokinase
LNFISIGEVLWDVVGEAEHLGGAPLNFSAHAAKLGHGAYLVSAVGADPRGRKALSHIRALGLTTDFIPTLPEYPTGYVSVTLHDGGQPCFTIHRPAAYDFAQLAPGQLEQLARLAPSWIYFGTLAQTNSVVRSTTSGVIAAAPRAKRFYDVNLRANSYDREVVSHLLASATLTKLNDVEIGILENLLGDPHHKSIEEFCRKWAARFGWEAACVTRGDKGCALLLGSDYVESPAYPITVVDAIGAGDAFAAGLMHALSSGWDAKRSADFANRLGALIASRTGAIPAWNLRELDAFAPPPAP